MTPAQMRAKMKALDAIDELLDSRDADDARKYKDAAYTDDSPLGDSEPDDEDASHKSTQEAPDEDGESDTTDDSRESAEDGTDEDDDGFMDDLKRMASDNSGARGALSFLTDEDEDHGDDPLPKKGKRKDSSRG